MKKTIILLIFILIFPLILFSTSCEKKLDLSKYVSDLREDVFVGESQTFSIQAHLGKREDPFIQDGKIGLIKPRLLVKIVSEFNKDTEVVATLTFNEQNYVEKFSFNGVANTLTATFNLDNFNLKTFDITLTFMDKSESITLSSIKPENTLTYVKALDCLLKKQPTLIQNYLNENNQFQGEIFLRLLVNNDTPYYYVGLSSNEKIVALLIHGVSGKILSIKEVF